MTREEFFSNIKNVNEDDILQAFDSLMAFFNFYNAIGIYKNVEITKTDSELANFDVKFESDFNVSEFCRDFSGLKITIYGVKWNVECSQVDDHTLHINLIL